MFVISSYDNSVMLMLKTMNYASNVCVCYFIICDNSVKIPDFTGSVRAGVEQSPKTQTEKQNIRFFSFGFRALFCASAFRN